MDWRKGHQRAVLVGIDCYEHGIPRLQTPVHDAQALGRLLRDKHGYEVRHCLDEEATSAGLRALLKDLAREVAEPDRVFFYFAGHGVALNGEDGPRGYFVPVDARRDDLTTFLPMSEVQELLSRLKCRHQLVVLDCCFAGAFRWSVTRDLRVQRKRIYRERYERYLREPAWQVITSAAHDEKALDVLSGYTIGQRGVVGDHSPFARALMEGLAGKADFGVDGEPGDGLILASELHLYLEEAMHRLEEHTDRDQQRPMLWSWLGRDKGQFLFHVPGCQPVLPSALELNEKNNPYRGLEPYEEEHEGLFFGRAKLADDLCQHVVGHPLSVVVGTSGAGKSSLVRAGLIPRLRRNGWHVLPAMRPGTDPMAALARVKSGLAEVARQAVLIVDQLEELVTLVAAPTERERFLGELLSAVRTGHLHMVMTLRADFEPHFSRQFQEYMEAGGRFLVRPMEREELREAIEGPASERVLSFEPPALVDRLIDEVIDMPGALPLLSFVLSEMYRAYIRDSRDDRALKESDYIALGGVAGALSRRADEVRACLDEAHRATLDRVMLRMVAMQVGEVARRRVYMREFDHGPGSAEQARIEVVLRRLEDARLVIADKDAVGEKYVEPAHDKLILGWQHLWKLLTDGQEELQLHRRLTQAATDWDVRGRVEGWLWSTDPRLPQVVLRRKEDPDRFNAVEEAFISYSQEKAAAEAERDKRRIEELQAARDQAEAEARRAKLEARRAKDSLRVSVASLLDVTKDAVAAAVLLEDVEAPEETRGWEAAARKTLSQLATLVLLRPGRDIVTAAFSPDGTQVVTGYRDGTLRVWRMDGQGDPVVLHGPRGEARYRPNASDDDDDELLERVSSVAFSPDGTRVVAGSNDGMAWVWQADGQGDPVSLSADESPVWAVAFSPDGTRVVTGSNDGMARVWRADGQGKPVFLRGYEGAIMAVAFSPDGTRVVTGSNDGTARMWQVDEAVQSWWRRWLRSDPVVLRGHKSPVSAVAFSPDGTRVVTVSHDDVWVWRADGRGDPVVLRGDKSPVSPVSAVAFCPDGTRVVTGADDGTARVWRADGQGDPVVLRGHKWGACDVAFSSDSTRLFTASRDGTVRVWRASGQGNPVFLRGHECAVTAVVFSPDGTRVATGSMDGTVRVWRADGQDEPVVLRGHRNLINAVAFSPDGTRVITVSYDKTVRAWRADGEGAPVILRGHKGLVYAVAFSPDGTRVVTGSEDWTVRMWKVDGQGDSVVLRGHRKEVIAAAFSPDGTRLVTASQDGTARIWRADGQGNPVVLRGHQDGVNAAAFSADGLRVVTGSMDGTVRVWRADGQDEPVVLRRHLSVACSRSTEVNQNPDVRVYYLQMVHSVAFGPDGIHVVAGSEDGTARVWRADGQGDPVVLRDHEGRVSAVAFSSDGTRIFAASRKGTARVWRADGQSDLVVLSGKGGDVRAVAFSPDGTQVVAGSRDGTASVWQARPLRESLAAAVSWSLTPEERMQFLGETEEEARARFVASEHRYGRTVQTG